MGFDQPELAAYGSSQYGQDQTYRDIPLRSTLDTVRG